MAEGAWLRSMAEGAWLKGHGRGGMAEGAWLWVSNLSHVLSHVPPPSVQSSTRPRSHHVFCLFHRLPDGFTQLRNLTVLALNDISLARLPPDIGR